MSPASERTSMIPTSRAVRAYFAPVSRPQETAAIFDPAKHAAFDLDAPPAPWLGLGSIDHFDRRSLDETDVVRSGAQAVPSIPYRRSSGARLEFDFCDWGKLQMALACGSQHINVLACDPNADLDPLGGTPIPGVALLPGSTATEIVLGTGAVNSFQTGDLVAIDLDYLQQTGYIGTGIPGDYVRDSLDVHRDPDFVRRVTFNVGRVALRTATSLVLAQPLLGGSPPTNASVQKVIAFADREGGCFFQEWSGLFIFQEDSGGRICLYYPRLISAPPPGQAAGFARETRMEVCGPIGTIALHASFVALPRTDTLDGESILCYRSYFPASQSNVY